MTDTSKDKYVALGFFEDEFPAFVLPGPGKYSEILEPLSLEALLNCANRVSEELKAVASENKNLRAQLNAVRDDRDRISAAIKGLENAHDAVCADRSQATYDQMIADGQADALLELDKARSEARAALKSIESGENQ